MPNPTPLRASWGALSDYRDVLYGIAIALIVLFHLFESTVEGTAVHSILWLFNHMSAGVDAFLFLSSMGLYFAFSSNRSLPRFYKRRLGRILPTFLVIAVPFYLWRDIVVTSTASFLPNFLNVSFLVSGYRQFWYVYAILLLYLLYPLLYRFICDAARPFARTAIVIGGCFVLAVALGVVSPKLLSNTEIMLTRFPAFVAGVYAGKLVKERAEMKSRQVLVLLAVALVLWALSRTSLLTFGKANIASRYFYTCAAVLLCMLVPQILEAFRCARDQQPLAFLGRISLEMYIVNVAFRTIVKWYWGDFFFSGSNAIQIAYCVLIVAGTIAGAYALHRAMDPLTKKLLGGK